MTDQQKFSYSVGFQVGQQIFQRMQSSADIDLDAAAFAEAIEDVFSGGEPKLAVEEMQAVLEAERSRQIEKRQALGAQNEQRGTEFMAANKAKDGVEMTASGIHYRVIEAGSGKQPGAEDTVVVHYAGQLVDGTEFDSSYKRGQPATFSLGGIIKGWQEILPLMQEGAKWEIVIPPALAYGPNGGGSIGPNETLVFTIELIEVK
jgi:FKBP-type peptidyl-prolyl cis-trans isomerase FklB